MVNQEPDNGTLVAVGRRYGFDAADLTLLRDITNPIYEIEAGQGPSILRLSSARKRSLPMIEGELEWMRYLNEHGIGVPAVRPSHTGKLVETITHDGESWFAVLFEKVPGVHPERELLSEEVIRQWGRMLGKMHRLATQYQPSSPAIKRPHWHELDVFQLERRMPEQFRAENAAVLAAWRKMQLFLDQLPKGTAEYGLIHADIEPWNMLLHNGRLILIDFEECCYNWFLFDLVVSFTHAVMASWRYSILKIGNEENDRYVQFVWDVMLDGYRREYVLDGDWLAAVPAFLRFRVLQDYVHGLVELASGTDDEWLPILLAEQRYIIESDWSFRTIKF